MESRTAAHAKTVDHRAWQFDRTSSSRRSRRPGRSADADRSPTSRLHALREGTSTSTSTSATTTGTHAAHGVDSTSI